MAEYLIIAGTGALPQILKDKLPDARIVGFESDKPHVKTDLLTSFGEVGKVIGFAKDNGIKKIIFAGGMKRPNFSDLKTDAEGVKLLARIVAGKLFSRGDNSLLVKVIEFLESRDLAIVGAHEAVPELLAGRGSLNSIDPNPRQMDDIQIGLKAAHELGRKDIGQAVIVEDGKIIASEDREGTEKMIERAKPKTYGGVLVKACKPQQDLRVDLPSIGPDTILQLKKAGISGVAVEAGKSLLLEKEKLINLANANSVFIYGA